MIFQQLFDQKSGAFTYVIAQAPGCSALIVDPVLEETARYLNLFERLNLTLAVCIDTHLHADHVTGAAALADATGCDIAMSEHSVAAPLDRRLSDGDMLEVGGVALEVLHTPGHTPDSLCLRLADRVLTGDTLLIGATGRTDLAGGDAGRQYRAIMAKLMSLPDDILVYPGHDYSGADVSTIGHERAWNPRLSARSAGEYARTLAKLDLPPPRAMRRAIPANLRLGRMAGEEIA